MNSAYAVNVARDCAKIDTFALELAKKIGLRWGDYKRWDVIDDRFYLVFYLDECGCEDSYFFPLGWLDVPFDEIVRRWYASYGKAGCRNICGRA